MRYHNITTDDMLNGDGLRVVLWLSGCEHHCKYCQNPLTWDVNSGLIFDERALEELFDKLEKPHISGITFSGGDPLHPENRAEVLKLAKAVKGIPAKKTVWLYTGYAWEQIFGLAGIENIDVLVDGKFAEELADVNYPWAGSTNQRVIDVQKSIETGKVVLHKCFYEDI